MKASNSQDGFLILYAWCQLLSYLFCVSDLKRCENIFVKLTYNGNGVFVIGDINVR